MGYHSGCTLGCYREITKGYTLSDGTYIQHGDFKVPVTDLRKDLTCEIIELDAWVFDLSPAEQRALIDVCRVPGSFERTEENYLELIHYLYMKHASVLAIHPRVRCFSSATRGLTVRLAAEQSRDRNRRRELVSAR